RAAVGDKMDIMVELHGLWRYPAALKVAAAIEQYDPFWYEDPIRLDSLQALTDFASTTRVPVCVNETLGSPHEFRDLMETGAAAVVMPDLSWCGGLTAAKKIAAIADTYHRPIAPHDCCGPVGFFACVHLSLSAPNVLIQESVRAFYTGWYNELVTNVPPMEAGHILPPSGVGLGTELLPDFTKRKDATVVSATL
ncbi:MAG: enolase C-terminal domain-like protein, partial [Pseudomonadota bacterium]